MKKILLTGATGYIGGVLLTRLLESGFSVRALARNPSRLTPHPNLEVIRGDILDLSALQDAMIGCELAYYLIHGLNEPSSFEYQEALFAQTFTKASNESGLSRVIYLGGLGEGGALSPHLRSRQLTGKILALGRVPVTEFRASIVLGEGSTSYEMMKALVQRLPFFIEPANLSAKCQPIFYTDLVDYLVKESTRVSSSNEIFELGGLDQISYSKLLLRLADHSGIRRKVIAVPEIDPRILAEAFELVCPEYARVGRHLMESLIYPTVVTEDQAQEVFPEIHPRGLDEALDQIGTFQASTRELLTPAHMLKILKMLTERFPQIRGLGKNWIHL